MIIVNCLCVLCCPPKVLIRVFDMNGKAREGELFEKIAMEITKYHVSDACW